MLGHQLFSDLKLRHDVKVTLRRDLSAYQSYGGFTASNAYEGVEVHATDRLLDVVADFRPDVIINAIGIVKQLSVAKESIPSLEVNALLPHRLALIARTVGARFLHFSTDCVFSGRKGNYSEADTPDPEDLYGRSKLLGEVGDAHCLTLRISLIGHELDRKTSLVEWFLSQKGQVQGFLKANFSGFTTIEMARIVEMLIVKHPEAHGIWHVSSEPIDKCSLLTLVKKHYGVGTEIIPNDDFRCDRSLNSARFRERFDYRPPTWASMIEEMSKQRSLHR